MKLFIIVLDTRLNKRVDGMLAQGLVKELTDFHTQYNADRIKDGRYEVSCVMRKLDFCL